MKCETVLMLIDDYLEGRLSYDLQLKISRHLDACYNCSLNLMLIERKRLRIVSTEAGTIIVFEYEKKMGLK